MHISAQVTAMMIQQYAPNFAQSNSILPVKGVAKIMHNNENFYNNDTLKPVDEVFTRKLHNRGDSKFSSTEPISLL